MVYASVDLGGTKIACGVSGADLEWIGFDTVRCLAHEGPIPVLSRMLELVRRVSSGTALGGVGVGVPGWCRHLV